MGTSLAVAINSDPEPNARRVIVSCARPGCQQPARPQFFEALAAFRAGFGKVRYVCVAGHSFYRDVVLPRTPQQEALEAEVAAIVALAALRPAVACDGCGVVIERAGVGQKYHDKCRAKASWDAFKSAGQHRGIGRPSKWTGGRLEELVVRWNRGDDGAALAQWAGQSEGSVYVLVAKLRMRGAPLNWRRPGARKRA